MRARSAPWGPPWGALKSFEMHLLWGTISSFRCTHIYDTHTHIYILYNISGYVYIYINPHPELLRCQILFVIVYHLQSWYQMPHSWWLYETLRKTKETMNHCGFSWHISAGGTSPKRNDGMWNQQKRQHFKTEIEKHSILSTSIIYPSFHWST